MECDSIFLIESLEGRFASPCFTQIHPHSVADHVAQRKSVATCELRQALVNFLVIDVTDTSSAWGDSPSSGVRLRFLLGHLSWWGRGKTNAPLRACR